jgi:hypothetical protein
LTENMDRNRLIATDVIQEADTGNGTCLIPTDRKEHCHTLAALISPAGRRPANHAIASSRARRA